jgi:hypothetical protein
MSILNQFSPIEALVKTRRILRYRPDDKALLHFQQLLSGQAVPGDALTVSARKAMAASPWESFILLEMNRFLLYHDYTIPLAVKQTMGYLYQQLAQWLPHDLLWNQVIASSLASVEE